MLCERREICGSGDRISQALQKLVQRALRVSVVQRCVFWHCFIHSYQPCSAAYPAPCSHRDSACKSQMISTALEMLFASITDLLSNVSEQSRSQRRRSNGRVEIQFSSCMYLSVFLRLSFSARSGLRAVKNLNMQGLCMGWHRVQQLAIFSVVKTRDLMAL